MNLKLTVSLTLVLSGIFGCPVTPPVMVTKVFDYSTDSCDGTPIAVNGLGNSFAIHIWSSN